MKKSVKTALAAAVVAALFLSAFGVVSAQSGGADRVVEDGEAVFLDEEDIDTEAGVFENLDPGEFTDADGRTLSFSNGVIDPSNAISTYTATDPTGDNLSVDVRVARIQRIRPIRAASGARLDFPGTPRVRQGRNNLQFAVNYNYFESTEIDEELRQDGSDVTRIYLEQSQDRAVTGSQTEATDGKSYDAVFTFSIDDTGEYEFVAEPLTGDDRPDGRDVGFDDGGEASVRGSINVGFEETQDDEDGEEAEEDENVTEGQDDEGEMDGEDGNVTDGEDGDGDMEGGEDGNATDGQDDDGEMGGEDDGMDGEEDENVTDGQDGEMNGEEDGNVTDGEDGDVDGEEDENVSDGEEDEDGDGDGSEGLPGFTAVTALLALVACVAMILRQKTES